MIIALQEIHKQRKPHWLLAVRLPAEDLASMLPVSDSVLCNFKRPFPRRMVAPVMDMLEMVLDFLWFDQNVGRFPNFESSQHSSPAGL